MSHAYEDLLDQTVAFLSDAQREHLIEVGEVDLSEPCWSFHLLRFWVRKRDGQILYATDSGCSCPMPFEDVTVSELKETTLKDVLAVARREGDQGEYGGTRVVVDVSNLIHVLREAGAL